MGLVGLQLKTEMGIIASVQIIEVNLTMPLTTSLAIFICGLFISLNLLAKDLEGKIVGVSDGDTATMLVESPNGKLTVKIRLAQIDAPEKSQPWGQKSKQALSDLIYGKTIRAEVETKDRYARVVANLYDGNTWINERMVANGHAWMYRQYSSSPQIAQAESHAKENRLGLWSLPEAERVPPWEWRRGNKANSPLPPSTQAQQPAQVSSSAINYNSSCGSKRTCSKMTSCDEAKFYLLQCGVKTLDKDGDGVPCENLCK